MEALEVLPRVAELSYRKGPDVAMDVSLVWAALMERPLASDFVVQIEKGASAKFPVEAADLMPEFQGPALGAELERLKTDWITSDFSLTKADLLR